MSEHTPITGELRDTLERGKCTFTNSAGFEQVNVTKDALDSMLDAIDAVHAALERENAGLRERLAVLDKLGDSMRETDAWKLGYDEGFASADDWLAQHEDAMAEHGWVRGPLDKDGKLWSSGDMSDSNWGEIEGIVYENGKWFIRGHDTSAPWIPADSIGHHHAPTVEDVLREFGKAWVEWEDGSPYDPIAKFAAKLRLAEVEDA